MRAGDASGRRAPLVCHWNGWDQFLARWLLGDERGLAVSFGEDVREYEKFYREAMASAAD